MPIVVSPANRLSLLYASLPDDVFCRRYTWNETEDMPPEFQAAVNETVSEKQSLYLFRSELYDYPLPFLVKAKGMWSTWEFRSFLFDHACAEQINDTPRCQVRFGVGRVSTDFLQWDCFEKLFFSDVRALWPTDKLLDSQRLLSFFQKNDGHLNLPSLLQTELIPGNSLMVSDICDGEYLVDILSR